MGDFVNFGVDFGVDFWSRFLGQARPNAVVGQTDFGAIFGMIWGQMFVGQFLRADFWVDLRQVSNNLLDDCLGNLWNNF